MIALQGSWEKKLIERVHNVAKTGKRSCSDPTTSASKRGRPKDAPLMQRYPPLPCVDDEIHENEKEEQALKKELQKEKPRKEVIIQLMRATFQCRRCYILTKSSSETVLHVSSNFKALTIPYVVSMTCLFYCDIFVLLMLCMVGVFHGIKLLQL